MKVGPYLLSAALASLLGCASLQTTDPGPPADRRGYSVNPADFWGVNFKPGEPTDGFLLDALSSSRDLRALENDLAVLKAMPPSVPLRVFGFTDSKECTGEACPALSLRRAQLLHDWLLNQGIPKNRLGTPVGFGSARPIGDNETVEGRAINRRAYVSYETQSEPIALVVPALLLAPSCRAEDGDEDRLVIAAVVTHLCDSKELVGWGETPTSRLVQSAGLQPSLRPYCRR